MLADFIAFISNSLTITVLVAYVFALWAALVAWTWLDISNRTDNVMYRLGAVLIVATGAILGFAIYLLLRPAVTRDEAYLREVEEAILVSQSQFLTCPSCHSAVKEEFTYCQNCAKELKSTCPSCSREVNIFWTNCPYCGWRIKEEVEIKPAVAFSTKTTPSLRERSSVIFSSVNNLLKKINEQRPKRKTRRKSASKAKKLKAKIAGPGA